MDRKGNQKPTKLDNGGKWAHGAAVLGGNQKGDDQNIRHQYSDASSSNKGGNRQNQSNNRNDDGSDKGWTHQ
eukprot:11677615-Ditylum_brightwellii.AAC.1